MGRYTRTELIAAGQARVGNNSTAVTTRIQTEFQAWLDRQYAGWSWPFLKKRATGLTLAQGATSLTVGAGSGGVTLEIIKLVSPLGFYTTDRSTKGKAHIVPSADSDVSYDETLASSSTFIGTPTEFKARHGSVRGSWDLVPLPFPDRALLLSIDYYGLPAILGASDIPIYPADSTLIDAIAAMVHDDQYGPADPRTVTAWDRVSSKMAYDRSTYGSAPGENDRLDLDTSVFR